MYSIIKDQIAESIKIKQLILDTPHMISNIYEIAQEIVLAYNRGNSLLLCGNGGSASDAQHIAGEMVGRFRVERRALPAIAFNTNSSIITAIGNDYEYNMIFERQVEAFGRKGDILLSISTSGNSESVYKAITKARIMGIRTISLLGKTGGKCKNISETSFIVPSFDTPRIQECHIMIGHIICDIVEKNI